jgi:hypothetical protein
MVRSRLSVFAKCEPIGSWFCENGALGQQIKEQGAWGGNWGLEVAVVFHVEHIHSVEFSYVFTI